MYYVVSFLVGVVVGAGCFCVAAKQWYDQMKARDRAAKRLADEARADQELASAAHATAHAQLHDLALQRQALSTQRDELERHAHRSWLATLSYGTPGAQTGVRGT
jgi:hypothetical protein